MLPVPPNSIIIAEYVEHIKDVKDGECCIVVTTDGIVFKRVFTSLSSENKVLLISDNTSHKPYSLEKRDVIEVWRMRKIIFDEIFPPGEVNINQIASLVLQVQDAISKTKRRSK